MSLTIIQRALIFDGTGRKPFRGDVAFRDGVIVGIGKNLQRTGADLIVDAAGCALTPGFIDAHSHSDISVLAAPEATGKISQGVTTEVVGNCGLSVFPVSDLNREHLNVLYQQYNETISWSDISGYAKVINHRRPAVNIVSLCGHNTLRAAICGYEQQDISESELADLCRHLQSSLGDGAAGLSSGLLYVPGKFSGPGELAACLKGFGRQHKDKPYVTHLRSEGTELEQALAEAIAVCADSDLPHLHISHLKTAGKANWHKLKNVIAMIKRAENAGLNISADRYPYTESMTQLSVIVPPPYDNLGDRELGKLLQDEDEFCRFSACLTEAVPRERWQDVRLVSSADEQFAGFAGSKFCEISRIKGLPESLICAEILRADCSGAMAAFSGMSPDNLEQILQLSYVCCGSDESARPLDFQFGRSHPRGFGSFPRFIRMMRKNLPLEQIVRHCTALPAAVFNLVHKGIVAVGYDADLLLFDIDKIGDTADFVEPHSPAEGIVQVWVNGQLSYCPGEMNKIQRHGRFLPIR